MSNKPTVLVVDDESGILDTLRILLRKEGFDVTTAQGAFGFSMIGRRPRMGPMRRKRTGN